MKKHILMVLALEASWALVQGQPVQTTNAPALSATEQARQDIEHPVAPKPDKHPWIQLQDGQLRSGVPGVQLFGKLDADVESVRTSQPGPGVASSRFRITSNASRIGARGSNDLGGGFQAVWQIATRLNLSGTETGGGGGVFTLFGNTRAGISSPFGALFLGVWDTPFRQSYDKIDLFDNSHIASPMALLGSIGNGISGSSALPATSQGFPAATAGASVGSTGFHRRQKNSAQYWSPTFQNIRIKLAYSMDDPGSKTAAADPSLLSVCAAYDKEPFYVGVAYERHQDMKCIGGTNAPGTDWGARLVMSWHIADGRIGLIYEFLDYGATGQSSASRSALSLSGSYKLKAHTLGAVYTFADDLSGTSDTGASQISLRYGYSFTPFFEGYGQYTAIFNQADGTYNFGDGLNISTRPGATLSGFGVGLAYSF